MSAFGNALSNKEYILGLTKITTGRPKGLMYVESPYDIGFWRYLTERVCPGGYEIKPAAKLKCNGKRTLQKEYDKLNELYIVGVDSDLDYLCADRDNNAKKLNDSIFILHTFSYAKESLQCSLSAIDDIKERLVFEEDIDCKIVESLRKFSNIIYEALVLHLFQHNTNPAMHNDGIFWTVLKLPANTKLLKKNFEQDESVFGMLTQRISDFMRDYAIPPARETEFNLFSELLNNKGLVPDTAYQFIQGHVLYDSYVYPLLKMYRDKLISIERAKIGKECRSVEKEGEKEVRLGALENFYNKNNVLETLLNNSMNYFNEDAFIKMQSKLQVLAS